MGKGQESRSCRYTLFFARNIADCASNTPSEETNGRPQPGGIQPDGSILHVVDQSILEIAREYRFTVDEVQEYYDRCGAMDRTRARFKKMRDTLLALPEDDDAT